MRMTNHGVLNRSHLGVNAALVSRFSIMLSIGIVLVNYTAYNYCYKNKMIANLLISDMTIRAPHAGETLGCSCI